MICINIILNSFLIKTGLEMLTGLETGHELFFDVEEISFKSRCHIYGTFKIRGH